jgi:oligopeptide transport system substrate-binding protein
VPSCQNGDAMVTKFARFKNTQSTLPVKAWRVFVSACLALMCVGCQAPFQTKPLRFPNANTPRTPLSQTYHVALQNDPPTLDPARMTDLVSWNVMVNLHEGLYRYSLVTGRPEWGLAESVTKKPSPIAPHAERWTFSLRPHLKWSDGSPFHAESFCRAWTRVLMPQTPAEYAWMLRGIVGSEAEGFLSGKSILRGLTCPDARHVVVDFKTPIPSYLPDFLASPVALPLPAHPFNPTQGFQFKLGMGAYRLSDWHHGHQLRLIRNPYYWERLQGVRQAKHTVTRHMSPWEQVVFHIIAEPTTAYMAFQKKELDMVSGLPPLLLRRLHDTPTYHAQPLQAIQYLAFNTRKPPFNNRSLRCAVARTIAPYREGSAWLKAYLGIDDPVLMGLFPQDKALMFLKAENQSLGQASLRTALSDIKQPIVLGMKQNFVNKRLGEVLQWQLSQALGLRIVLQMQDWKVFLHQLRHDPPSMFRLDWYADFPDPDTFTTLFLAENPNNYTGYANAYYQALVKEAQRTPSLVKKRWLQSQASNHLVREACVVVPLFQPSYGYVAQKEKPRPHVTPMGLVQYR